MDGIGLGICFINSIPHIQQRGTFVFIDKTPDLLKTLKNTFYINEELLIVLLANNSLFLVNG